MQQQYQLEKDQTSAWMQNVHLNIVRDCGVAMILSANLGLRRTREDQFDIQDGEQC